MPLEYIEQVSRKELKALVEKIDYGALTVLLVSALSQNPVQNVMIFVHV